MAGTVPFWLLITTVAVYGAFSVAYGATIFQVEGECEGIVSCGSFIFDFVKAAFDLVTLGGLASPLPALVQPLLLLFFGLAWGFYIYSSVTDGVGAVVP